MRCVLAVDGGNTKTIAAIAALDGALLGVGYAGCSDIYNAHPDDGAADAAEAARREVERAVLAALAQAQAQAQAREQVTPADLLVGVFNMAGADWPEDLAFWRETATARGFGRSVIAQNDALGVLHLATQDAVGVSIVVGTGAATGARGRDGREWHSSFWQDETQGSTQLGQKTLFALYRSALGIEPPTSLTARVLEFLDAPSVEDVLHLFVNRLRPAPIGVDRLTRILLDEAHAGDSLALRVVREHGAALGEIASAAARMVGLEGAAFPLALAGGVFRHPTTTLEDAIVARVRGASPEVIPVRVRAEPVVGVLLEALAAANGPVAPETRDRLLATFSALAIGATSPTGAV